MDGGGGMRQLEELLQMLSFYDSCEVQGHVPIQTYVSDGTEAIPDWVPVTCARCGCSLATE